MDFKKHLTTAWESTLQFIVPVILLTLVQLIVVTLSLGILAPVTTAGYIQSLLQALRDGREPQIGDLFSEMRLFLPLFAFGVLAVFATFFGFLLLILPGLLVLAFLVFATIYMIPLMTDRKMGLFEAIKESWNMAVRKPIADQVVLMLLYLLIMSVGGSIPLAVLFAQPLATFLMLAVYDERLEFGRISVEQGPPPVPGSEV
ncbi:hypothetical protein UWK_01129 [Desulfocapsa sulfexigens DSM 10523]|uniref:Integral membrane protein n=1 Tax=Desulfocapsa sulfexigens (strain DSM 10523 / SB164P1) TaxID=1167006 RepID=M1P7M4_DESSD|nr:hypothetical protein [Desulfocapsa sulfexigens]AGF77697.1 hypothetical protein UWK_01129 [Desulfocapsa sulfexigens DSM 10523]